MATQGLVTVRKGGSVEMKFVAGSGGYNAENLAEEIYKHGLPKSLKTAQQLAINLSFGSEDSLVVMDANLVRYQNDEFRDFSEDESLYRSKFNDQEFNPRWSCGTADHSVVVDL